MGIAQPTKTEHQHLQNRRLVSAHRNSPGGGEAKREGGRRKDEEESLIEKRLSIRLIFMLLA